MYGVLNEDFFGGLQYMSQSETGFSLDFVLVGSRFYYVSTKFQ